MLLLLFFFSNVFKTFCSPYSDSVRPVWFVSHFHMPPLITKAPVTTFTRTVSKAGSILAPDATSYEGKSNTFQVDSSFSLLNCSATTSEMVRWDVVPGTLSSFIYTNCEERRKNGIVYIHLSCAVSHLAVRC